MVLSLSRFFAVLLLVFLVAFTTTPGLAHKDHNEAAGAQASKAELVTPRVNTPGAMHEMMEEHAEAMEAEAPESFAGRLMSWVGRTHPFAVHFPIALFPVALVALLLARRKGETVELIRALIVVAGAGSVIAAVLGWLTGGFVLIDTDWVHLWHRWIGTTVAVMGAGVGVWAFKHRNSVGGRTMVVALTVITVLLLIQGWLGASLVHGIDHMSF